MCVAVCLYICLYTTYMPGSCGGQEKAPDPLETGVTDGCGCWELNPDLLEEQPVLLTPEPFYAP